MCWIKILVSCKVSSILDWYMSCFFQTCSGINSIKIKTCSNVNSCHLFSKMYQLFKLNFIYLALTCLHKNRQFCSVGYLIQKGINQPLFQSRALCNVNWNRWCDAQITEWRFRLSIQKSSTSCQPPVIGGEFNFCNFKHALKLVVVYLQNSMTNCNHLNHFISSNKKKKLWISFPF